MVDYMPPIGGERHDYFPQDDECVDADGTPYPEHDYPSVGEGSECRRCGAEAEET